MKGMPPILRKVYDPELHKNMGDSKNRTPGLHFHFVMSSERDQPYWWCDLWIGAWCHAAH